MAVGKVIVTILVQSLLRIQTVGEETDDKIQRMIGVLKKMLEKRGCSIRENETKCIFLSRF